MLRIGNFSAPALLALWTLAISCGQKPQKSGSELELVDPRMVAADLSSPGSWVFEEHEYATPAAWDPEISPLLWTEGDELPIDIRGRLFLPIGGGPRPLVVLLHGNHSTCGIFPSDPRDPIIDNGVDFTFTGVCPEGSAEIPSYRGYDAAARQLASYGYAVASINANRGISGNGGRGGMDDYLVYVRGLLVLKHLEALQSWSNLAQLPSGVGSPGLSLRDRFNWGEVGLMGHSRGGEGVRFAHFILSESSERETWQRRLPGVAIRAIFEVGPVDRGIFTEQRIRRVAATGIDWAVLIPGCDADVSDFEGVSPFLRMQGESDGKTKAIYTLWGANHNFFNSQWQVSDAWHSCKGSQKPLWDTSGQSLDGSAAHAGLNGSLAQTEALKALMMAFFRAHLGRADERWLEGEHVFDPQYRLPRSLQGLGPSYRQFLRPSGSELVFEARTAPSSSSASVKVTSFLDFLSLESEQLAGEKLKLDQDGYKNIIPSFHEGNIVRPAWVLEPSETIGAVNTTVPLKAGAALSDFWTLDLSLGLISSCTEAACRSVQKDLAVALVFADGSSSAPVRLADYGELEAFQGRLLAEGREWTDRTGDVLHLTYVSETALYQQLRLELSDFGPLPQQAAPVGLRLLFPGAFSGKVLLESIRLSKKP